MADFDATLNELAEVAHRIADERNWLLLVVRAFVDHYPHGVNPDLDAAYGYAVDALHRIERAKAKAEA